MTNYVYNIFIIIPMLIIICKGGAALDLKTCPPKPYGWILDMVWLNLVELSSLPQFSNILNQVSLNFMHCKKALICGSSKDILILVMWICRVTFVPNYQPALFN